MADNIIAIVSLVVPGTTGNFDVTDPTAFGGATPKGALIFGGASAAAETIDARFMIGFAAGANRNLQSASSRDAQTSTLDSLRWRSDRFIRAGDSATNFILGDVSFIANGIRINFSAVVSGRAYTVILFGGTDTLAATGNFTAVNAASNQVTDVTSPTFRPNLVFLSHDGTAVASGTNANLFSAALGVAIEPGASPQVVTQKCWNTKETNAITAGGRPTSRSYADKALVGVNSADGSQVWTATLDTFDSAGFTVRFSGTTGGEEVTWLALQLPDAIIDLIDFTCPTATGNQSHQFPAFTDPFSPPTFGFIFGTSATAFNTTAFDVADANTYGVGAFLTGKEEAHNARFDQTADPTDTSEHTLAKAFAMGARTGCDVIQASLVSFDGASAGPTPGGYTLNWSAVSGTAHKLFGLALRAEGVAPPADGVRVTQSGALVLGVGIPPVRVTQGLALVLGEVRPPVRVTQTAVLSLISLTPCLTYRARLWKLTRLDGTVFGYTDHDEDLSLDGVTFKRCASLMGSATQTAAEADGVGDTQLTGILTDDDITQEDMFAGLFDGATIEIFEVSWDQTLDPLAPRKLAAGVAGPAKQSENRFTLDALSYGGLLSQRSVLQTVTPNCRFDLFDSRCGLSRAAFLETGTVTAIPTTDAFTQATYRRFTDVARTETGNYFGLGKLTWTTGRNVGVSSEVKLYGAGGVFLLWQPLPFEIQVGDEYEVVPGCDLLKPTCIGKFGNFVNFGGFPDLPGTDAIIKTPDAKQ